MTFAFLHLFISLAHFFSNLKVFYCDLFPSRVLSITIRLPGFITVSAENKNDPPITHHCLVNFFSHFSSVGRHFAMLSYNSIIPKSQPFFIRNHWKQLREGWAKFNQQATMQLSWWRRGICGGRKAAADAPVSSAIP